jgi:hypothetical protein
VAARGPSVRCPAALLPAARPVLLRWVLQTLLDVFFHVMKLPAKSATALLRFRGFASGVHRVSSDKRALLHGDDGGTGAFRGSPGTVFDL